MRMRMMMVMVMIYFMITSAEIGRKDGCYPQSCGDLTGISYPFSIMDSCGLPEFRLYCRNNASLSPNKSYAYINTIYKDWPLQVLNISADSLLVNVTDWQITAEADNCNVLNVSRIQEFVHLPAYPGPYLLSDNNNFTTWNCGLGIVQTGVQYQVQPDPGILVRQPNDTYSYGACFSDCSNSQPYQNCNFSFPSSSNISHVVEGQDYSACCSTNIPKPTRGLVIQTTPMSNSEAPCSVFASFFFSYEYKSDSTTFRLKLDWAIPYNKSNNQTYIQNDPSFACSDNISLIILDPHVPGYRCACKDGFIGNGYKNGTGCQDINECANANGTLKCQRYERCENMPGIYTCKCDFGCKLLKQIIPVALSLGAILLVILATISCYKWKQQKKFRYFLSNGGLQLQELMGGGADHAAKLYSIDDLAEATNNFSPSNKVGSGGFGIVYKGIMKKDNGREVAIKKARHYSTDEGDQQSFLNEMAILTSINHRHIVRMLGCCVEDKLPLLVYEYVSHGTLAECLELRSAHLPWNKRIDIAIQAGDALDYLHSAASPPILHRDVKSANILLDENMDAKVADFGASKLIPNRQSHVSTIVQGTIGYIDPEYVQSMQLTEKSDVYGFGVVLAELLTGLKPTDYKREGNDVSLAWMFVNKVSQGKVMEIVDPLILQNELGLEKPIERASNLIVRCLSMIGDKRPSMREVVEELYHVKSLTPSMDPLTLPHLEDKGSRANEAHWKLISTPPNESMETTTVKVSTGYFRIAGR